MNGIELTVWTVCLVIYGSMDIDVLVPFILFVLLFVYHSLEIVITKYEINLHNLCEHCDLPSVICSL